MKLIVNADDYGLTEAVSRGILRAHREGIVTSTSVLTVAPGFAASARWLVETPSLGVGVHLTVVGEDPPLSPPSEIPSLVDREGRLALSWKQFLPRALLVRPRDLETELTAQIERALDAGLSLTHLDSHQHLHVAPPLRDVALRLAARFRVPAIRVPRSRGRRLAGHALNLLARGLERRARASSLRTPDAAAGFDEAGRVDRTLLLETLRHLAKSRGRSAELGVHPGEHEDRERARYRWSYRWGEELDALIDPRVNDEVRALGFILATFRDLDA